MRFDRRDSARVWARFDDLVEGQALRFGAPISLLVAAEPADVVPVLAEVQRASDAGRWAFGYVAYEAAVGLDRRLAVADTAGNGVPLAMFGICHRPVSVPAVRPPAGRARNYTLGKWQRGWTARTHCGDVARVRDYIAAGQTYQLNLTSRLRLAVTGDPEQLYADLAWAQRGRYAAYMDLGRQVIASASPELFFRWSGNELLTRPMKGTARRGRTPEEDAEQIGQLLASEKERAENVMIVDLLRNDVSRIAEVGSVRVPALLSAERYDTVWQLTSDVTARLRPGTGLVEIFSALFPSGSVTGAPKQRTMELIHELEPEPRGVYCGAVGVVAPPGHRYRAQFSVGIRTLRVDRATDIAVYGAGGAITWASRPEAEYHELLAKTAILTEPYEEFALLETMAHYPGSGIRNFHRHLKRLSDSAGYFGFRFNGRAIRVQLAGAINHAGPARVRLTLRRDGSVHTDVGPLPPRPRRAVRLVVDHDPVDSQQRWLYHKTTRRHLYADRAARHRGADEVILTNEHGDVTESTIANLAVRLDGYWWTPRLRDGCLPGVERGRLLDSGDVRERRLTPHDLRTAQGLALISSLRGWRAARLLTEHD